MKAFLKEKTGRVPGFGFWDGETIEEYRERLRKIVEEVKKIKTDRAFTRGGKQDRIKPCFAIP